MATNAVRAQKSLGRLDIPPRVGTIAGSVMLPAEAACRHVVDEVAGLRDDLHHDIHPRRACSRVHHPPYRAPVIQPHRVDQPQGLAEGESVDCTKCLVQVKKLQSVRVVRFTTLSIGAHHWRVRGAGLPEKALATPWKRSRDRSVIVLTRLTSPRVGFFGIDPCSAGVVTSGRIFGVLEILPPRIPAAPPPHASER